MEKQQPKQETTKGVRRKRARPKSSKQRAKDHRERKKKYIEELEEQIQNLKSHIITLEMKIDELQAKHHQPLPKLYEALNDALKCNQTVITENLESMSHTNTIQASSNRMLTPLEMLKEEEKFGHTVLK